MDYNELKEFLDEKVNQYQHPNFIQSDPIQIPKNFSCKEDIEIAAFLTATISWGNRRSIIKNGNHLMQLLLFEPYNFVMESSDKEQKKLQKFVHRTFNGSDLTYFIKSLKNIYKNHGGLEQVFAEKFNNDHSIKTALEYFYTVFFEQKGERTRKHIANIAKGASGKRLNMFLRWMIRKGSVDFGLWQTIPSSALMLPLDVHTGNVGRKLGLLKRKSNDWKAVEEITENLQKMDKNDPIKYDFALFGLGVFEDF